MARVLSQEKVRRMSKEVEHKDIMKRAIKIGDQVAFVAAGYGRSLPCLKIGVVTRINPKSISVKALPNQTWDETLLRPSYRVLVLV